MDNKIITKVPSIEVHCTNTADTGFLVTYIQQFKDILRKLKCISHVSDEIKVKVMTRNAASNFLHNVSFIFIFQIKCVW